MSSKTTPTTIITEVVISAKILNSKWNVQVSDACHLWLLKQYNTHSSHDRRCTHHVNQGTAKQSTGFVMKGPRFESPQKRQENFLCQGPLFVLFILVSIPPPPPPARVHFLCCLFWYPFPPPPPPHRVTAVAHKRSQSFCHKCRWQVTAIHTWPIPMWLWTKWHCKLVQGCMCTPRRTCA